LLQKVGEVILRKHMKMAEDGDGNENIASIATSPEGKAGMRRFPGGK
jgi:hypothetical protein